jgi:hypothetical protein
MGVEDFVCRYSKRLSRNITPRRKGHGSYCTGCSVQCTGLGLPELYEEQQILAHVAANPGINKRTISAAEVFTAILFGGYYTKIGCIIICNVYRVLSWRICLAV